MTPFEYTRAKDPANALTLAQSEGARYLGGGTNLLDLMKEGVEGASRIVDLTGLPLATIQEHAGGLRIGALMRNADTAEHPLVRSRYPLLAQAILSGASGQIRNMATDGGNLLQRTRCAYFYDTALPCNKRKPGSGCGAAEGLNRMHAIFGWSDHCVAVHPSDMCVALAALDASVLVKGRDGKERSIPFADFHRLPGDAPERDNNLHPGDLILAIDLPKSPFAARSHYLKVRDRASYAFALVSVGAALDVADGKIRQARVAMGGVAHKPWRAHLAEQYLVGKSATKEYFAEAAKLEMAQAKPLGQNGFKVQLGQATIVRALVKANGGVA